MGKQTGILKDLDSQLKQLERPEIEYKEAKKLLDALYGGIQRNIKREPIDWSIQNWRFTQEVKMSKENLSKEKMLEKKIAALAARSDKSWANQVPAASGLVSQMADRKRSIDLVFKCKSQGEYDFIELKTTSNTPYYAAVENVCYGLFYLTHLGCESYLNRFPEKELLKGKIIHLKVLAPVSYYGRYNFEQLKSYEKNLNTAVIIFSSEITKIKMDLCFEEFEVAEDVLSESIFSNRNRRKISNPEGNARN